MTPALAERAYAGPFIGDPMEVARSYRSLAQSQRRLAWQYTRWAKESRTDIEARKWAGEAAKRWAGAHFAVRKYREYVESAIG